MTSTVELSDLRHELPEWPDDVLEEWLLPSARRHGWPPSTAPEMLPSGAWRDILLERPLVFWKTVHWRPEERPLDRASLSTESIATLDGLRAMTYGRIGLPRQDSLVRIARALQFISRHGVMPKRIAVLEAGTQLDVADGYHRLCAYEIRRDTIQVDPVSGQATDGGVLLNSRQPMWVGRSGH